MGSPEVGADLLNTEQRRLLDRPFRELTQSCLVPCKNRQCKERKKFKGVTDNARVPCRMRVFENDDDITEATDNEIPEEIFRGSEMQFGHQALRWIQRTPRQLFLYNEQILKNDLVDVDVLKIKCICQGCRKVVSECDALDTKEKLHLEVKENIAHDRHLPLLYIPTVPNLDIPDDAGKVCGMSHGADVNKFANEVLPKHIQTIKASLAGGALKRRLQEKGEIAKRPEKFGNEKMTYIRIGLGLKELGPLTAVLELWPRGYQSPKHHHGGCAGSIRLLHGELKCRLYRTLLADTPMEFQDGDCGLKLPPGSHKELTLKEGQTTWLNRQNWWVHEVWCGEGDFALSLHLYKSCTDEFAFVKKQDDGSADLDKPEGGPKNDFFWNLPDIGLPVTDDRIKEIGQKDRPKDFVETVLKEVIGAGAEQAEEERKAAEAKEAAEDAEAERSSGRDIWRAALLGELRVVRHHLRQNPALLNEKWVDGATPLTWAAASETDDSWPNAAVVELLLQRNADVAAVERFGKTALHEAAEFGNAEVAKRLLAANAPLNVKSDYGETPLDTAKRKGKDEVVKILEDAAAH